MQHGYVSKTCGCRGSWSRAKRGQGASYASRAKALECDSASSFDACYDSLAWTLFVVLRLTISAWPCKISIESMQNGADIDLQAMCNPRTVNPGRFTLCSVRTSEPCLLPLAAL